MAEASGGRPHRRQENLPPTGFEDRDDHRTACASRCHCPLSQRGFYKRHRRPPQGKKSVLIPENPWPTSAAARFSNTAWETSILRDISVAPPHSTPRAE